MLWLFLLGVYFSSSILTTPNCIYFQFTNEKNETLRAKDIGEELDLGEICEVKKFSRIQQPSIGK